MGLDLYMIDDTQIMHPASAVLSNLDPPQWAAAHKGSNGQFWTHLMFQFTLFKVWTMTVQRETVTVQLFGTVLL